MPILSSSRILLLLPQLRCPAGLRATSPLVATRGVPGLGLRELGRSSFSPLRQLPVTALYGLPEDDGRHPAEL